jgi:Mn-containing catalase
VANIAAEEFGHIELVAETINSMLTGASPTTNGDGSISGVMSDVKDARNGQQFITGRPRRLPRTPTAGHGRATMSSPQVT